MRKILASLLAVAVTAIATVPATLAVYSGSLSDEMDAGAETAIQTTIYPAFEGATDSQFSVYKFIVTDFLFEPVVIITIIALVLISMAVRAVWRRAKRSMSPRV